MSLPHLVRRVRAREEIVLMHAVVRVDRPGAGLGAFDPNTGQHADNTTVGVYNGSAAVLMQGNPSEQDRFVADDVADILYYQLRFPAGTDIRPGDLVTVTADPINPARIGLVLTVDTVAETAVSLRAKAHQHG